MAPHQHDRVSNDIQFDFIFAIPSYASGISRGNLDGIFFAKPQRTHRVHGHVFSRQIRDFTLSELVMRGLKVGVDS